jgi:carboxyl-terminal processing protease
VETTTEDGHKTEQTGRPARGRSAGRHRLPALVVLIVVAAFAGGYALATSLAARGGGLSTPQGAALAYRQVLSDLQQHYYRPVDVGQLAQTGINGLLKTLNDPYMEYFTPAEARAFAQMLAGTYSGVGMVLQQKGSLLQVTSVLPGSPAAQARVRAGDTIVKVDGVLTTGRSLDANIAHLQGKAGTTVHLELRRPGTAGLIKLTLTRRELSFPLTSSRLILDQGVKVGYVRLSEFASGAGAAVQQDVSSLQKRGAQWIVFDLRDNGGGLVDEALKVASEFLPKGAVIVSTQGLHSAKDVSRAAGPSPTALPMVVLVNGNTASSSEIVAGALKDNRRATLIGSRTFGKGVVQEVMPLAGGASLRITVAAYRTPSGADINHKGIAPTIAMPAGPATGKDTVLTRALQFIASGH